MRLPSLFPLQPARKHSEVVPARRATIDEPSAAPCSRLSSLAPQRRHRRIRVFQKYPGSSMANQYAKPLHFTYKCWDRTHIIDLEKTTVFRKSQLKITSLHLNVFFWHCPEIGFHWKKTHIFTYLTIATILDSNNLSSALSISIWYSSKWSWTASSHWGSSWLGLGRPLNRPSWSSKVQVQNQHLTCWTLSFPVTEMTQLLRVQTDCTAAFWFDIRLCILFFLYICCYFAIFNQYCIYYI